MSSKTSSTPTSTTTTTTTSTETPATPATTSSPAASEPSPADEIASIFDGAGDDEDGGDDGRAASSKTPDGLLEALTDDEGNEGSDTSAATGDDKTATGDDDKTPVQSMRDKLAERRLERLKQRTAAEIAKRTGQGAAPAAPAAGQLLTLDQFRELAQSDPAAALSAIGLDPAEFAGNAAAAVLQLGQTAESGTDSELVKEVKALRKRLDDQDAQARAAAEARDAAGKIEAAKAQAFDEVSSAATEYPKLLALPDAKAQVWGLMSSYYQTYGHVLSPRKAAEYIERHLAGAGAAAPAKTATAKAPAKAATGGGGRRAVTSAQESAELSLDPRERTRQTARMLKSLLSDS